MDTLENYRETITHVLQEHAQTTYAHGDIQHELIVDKENDHYFLVSLGWEGVRRIHACVVHIDIIDGKIWIQEDNTYDGVASELVAVGIPAAQIVLGFHSERSRQYTEFAVG
jgi:hypothetical protein